MTAPRPLGTLLLVPSPLDTGIAQPTELSHVVPLGVLQTAAR